MIYNLHPHTSTPRTLNPKSCPLPNYEAKIFAGFRKPKQPTKQQESAKKSLGKKLEISVD
jgi:hypothetical protein